MLRVFLPAAPRADRADRWVRFGADGRAIARGQDVPSHWPADPATEAVLAARHVRVVALALPPMPRERLPGAARYALEDQLATRIDESSIAVAEPRGGTCVAAVASEALIGAITAHERRIDRIVPESALAPQADGWVWCASAAGGGFVRREDGSAFAVDAQPDGTLPAGLAVALEQGVRAKGNPSVVHVAFAADGPQLAEWSRTTGVRFVGAPAWQWELATPATVAGAPDFLREAAQRVAGASRTSLLHGFRPALVLAGLALAIHLGGLLLSWTWLNVENWRLSRAIVDEAAAAQLRDAPTAQAAFAAIARQNAQLRHRTLQHAPADALPLLARAASALGALPPHALRSARYASDAWTLELAKVEPAVISRVTRSLTAAGIDALAAPAPGGIRVRLSLAPTAR
jgi:hypothetical protein